MSQVKAIYYAGYQPGASGFGWATCNEYLVRELSKLCEVLQTNLSGRVIHPVFMPLADHNFEPVAHLRGPMNFAYTFFESELGPDALENSKLYDIVFCGSTWCLERMKERGITNGQVLIQGVDHEIFKPMDVPRDDSFRIFSGGKFEYRKGQDIVIAAFRELCKRHDNLKLVTAWHNPWPVLINSSLQQMDCSQTNIKANYKVPEMQDQTPIFTALTIVNGIPAEKVEHHGQLSQPELAALMNSTDIGVFPNRCEGGTNLVLMEYMACGRPVVATIATGHLDILDGYNAQPCNVINRSAWLEAKPEMVADAVECLMDSDYERRQKAERALETISQFTWQRAAKQIVEAIEAI